MQQRPNPRNFSFKTVLLCCLLFAGSSLLRAERLPIKIYTSADGLGSSAAFALVRDTRGFIWLCSRDGLVRFDGYRFITYRIGTDEADPAVFESLNDPQLPQGAAAVELMAGDLGDELAELARPARRWRADAADVVVEVEVGILDPHGMVEAEWHGD